MDFDTLAIHAGQDPDPATGAIITPIYQTSTYVQDAAGEHKGYEYSRTKTRRGVALENCLASLESAEYGIAFASGLARRPTLMHLLDAGDHVVVSDDVYGGVPAVRGVQAAGARLRLLPAAEIANLAGDHADRRRWSGSRRRRTRC